MLMVAGLLKTSQGTIRVEGQPLSGPLDDVSEQVLIANYDAGVASAAQHRSELVNPRDDRRIDVYGVRLLDRVL